MILNRCRHRPRSAPAAVAAVGLILLLAGFAGCSSFVKQDESYEYFNIGRQGTVNGRSMAWTVGVPASYRDGTPTPLILSLHFGGSPSTWYGGTFSDLLVIPALYELEAIVLSPTCPVSLSWWDEIMEGAVLALIDSVRSEFTIDEERIIVTGFSFGGIGTWYFAGTHPELFAAAIPIASQVSEEFLDSIGDIPLYIIHSIADEILPAADIQARVEVLEERGADVTLVLLNRLTHYETAAYVRPLKKALSWVRDRWR